MEPFELELISWIAEYAAKYGEPPDVERLGEEFEDFIPIELEGRFIVDDIADQALERKRLSFFISEMGKVIDKTRLEGKIIDTDVYAVMRTVSQAEDDEVAYTSYDRSRYKARLHTKSVDFFSGILNRAMGSLHAGDYCLIAARLGTGKSLTTQWQAREWMLKGMRVLFVSQEMLAMEIFSRIDGMVAAFNPLALRGEFGADIASRLKIAQMTAKRSKGEIYAPRGLKTPEHIAMAAKFFMVDAIIVDGVYQLAPDLMSPPSARWERITEVSGQLKQMALTSKLPMLATTQIKRVGKTEGFTPEDLAFADALGQDADQIIMLEVDTVRPNRITASMTKNRYGPNMSAMFDLDFDNMKVEEVR
jgi:replicative DNA helicase